MILMEEYEEDEEEEGTPIFDKFRWIRAYQDFDENNFYYAFTIPFQWSKGSRVEIFPSVTVASPIGLWKPKGMEKRLKVYFKPLKCFDSERTPIDLKFLEQYNMIIKKARELSEKYKFEHVLLAEGLKIELEKLKKIMNNDFLEIEALLKDYNEENLNMLYKIYPNFLFNLLKDVINYYIDYEKEEDAPKLIALWIIGTYLFTLFDCYPYLNFFGDKGSGKTKNLEILEQLAFNSIQGTSISNPSAFRLTEDFRTTVLVDETHQLSKSSDFRDFLLTGFSKYGRAWRIKEYGKNLKKFKPESFCYYSPKAMAGIKALSDVLLDRCIKITMVKTLSEKGDRKIEPNDPKWLVLRTLCYLFAFCYWKDVRDKYYNLEIKSDFHFYTRERDLWRPIFTLGEICNVDLINYAKLKIEEKRKEEEELNIDILILKLVALRVMNGEISIVLKDIVNDLSSRYNIELKGGSRIVGSALRKRKFTNTKISGGYTRYIIDPIQLERELKKEGLDFEMIKKQFEDEEKEFKEIKEVEEWKDDRYE